MATKELEATKLPTPVAEVKEEVPSGHTYLLRCPAILEMEDDVRTKLKMDKAKLNIHISDDLDDQGQPIAHTLTVIKGEAVFYDPRFVSFIHQNYPELEILEIDEANKKVSNMEEVEINRIKKLAGLA